MIRDLICYYCFESIVEDSSIPILFDKVRYWFHTKCLADPKFYDPKGTKITDELKNKLEHNT